jgi:SAM-dependent methyltransferase
MSIRGQAERVAQAGFSTATLQSRQAVSVSVAPDGSPVALYLTLPGAGEATLIHAAIPASAAILELGCGVGRVSRHLVALGHPVTGVDDSDAMLTHASRLEGVEVVLADIATLDLSPRAWPVVTLASHMVNDENGPWFLAAASQHLDEFGILLVERHESGWTDAARPSVSARYGVSFTLADVDHTERGVLRATMIYEVEGTTYRQQFVCHGVDDERLHAMAARTGLRVTGFLDGRRSWVVLRPTATRT